MNKGRFILSIIIAITTISCDRSDCDDCFTPPETFRMMIVDKNTGEDLLDGKTYFIDSLEIFYFQSQERKEAPFQIENFNSYERVIKSDHLPWISVGGDKTFYIRLNSQDTDTLYLHVAEYLYYCCRSYPYVEATINGNDIEMNYSGILLLKK